MKGEKIKNHGPDVPAKNANGKIPPLRHWLSRTKSLHVEFNRRSSGEANIWPCDVNFGLLVLSRRGEDEYNNLKYTKTALAACSIIRENKQAPLPPLSTQVLGFRSGLLSLYVNRVAETHHDTASPPALIPNVHDLLPELNWLWKRGRWGCCLLYTSPSPRDRHRSRMPSSA